MNLELGGEAEQKVRDYLENCGLSFVDANYQCKGGEIDLIMQDNEDLVFVEVRYRKKDDYGDGLESVTKYKQRKIIRAAKHYLQKRDLFDKVACRFDVVALDEGMLRVINWVKDAFWAKY